MFLNSQTDTLNSKFFKESSISIKSFKVKSLLGEGSFAKVYKATTLCEDQDYAIKVISKVHLMKLSLQDQLNREIDTLLKCDHENIIKLYAAFEDSQYIYLVLEYAEKGSLYQIFKEVKNIPESFIQKCIFDTAKALDYIHNLSPPIIHRDIKMENILVSKDGFKLADFGWSNTYNEFRNTFCGTPDYLSPEMILGIGHDQKVDIWSLGILFYELYHGKAPFTPQVKADDQRGLQRLLQANILSGIISINDNVSSDAKDLLTKLLAIKPSNRISAKNILKHDYVNIQSQKQGKTKNYYKKKLIQCEKTLQKFQIKIKDLNQIIEQKDQKIKFLEQQKDNLQEIVKDLMQNSSQTKKNVFTFDLNMEKGQKSDHRENLFSIAKNFLEKLYIFYKFDIRENFQSNFIPQQEVQNVFLAMHQILVQYSNNKKLKLQTPKTVIVQRQFKSNQNNMYRRQSCQKNNQYESRSRNYSIETQSREVCQPKRIMKDYYGIQTVPKNIHFNSQDSLSFHRFQLNLQ